jgi:hypothetical protein
MDRPLKRRRGSITARLNDLVDRAETQDEVDKIQSDYYEEIDRRIDERRDREEHGEREDW